MTVQDDPRTDTRSTSLYSRWASVLDAAPAWDPPPVPTVVVVPHPDDEALLFGGLIATQRARDVPVTVIAATDGEAAYDELGDQELGERRAREQSRSLSVLGARGTDVRLGLPDGQLARHATEIRRSICRHLDDGALLVAPWIADVHPDHEVCGVAALSAASKTRSTLMFGFFWTWHHRRPEDLSGRPLVALVLDDEAISRRRAALAEHRSQFDVCDHEPILDRALVEPVTWRREYYLKTPTP